MIESRARQNVTVRLSEAELGVLDALVGVKRIDGANWSRGDVFRLLLKRAKPSDELGEVHRAHRDAYQKAFPS